MPKQDFRTVGAPASADGSARTALILLLLLQLAVVVFVVWAVVRVLT